MTRRNFPKHMGLGNRGTLSINATLSRKGNSTLFRVVNGAWGGTITPVEGSLLTCKQVDLVFHIPWSGRKTLRYDVMWRGDETPKSNHKGDYGFEWIKDKIRQGEGVQ